MPEVAPRAVPTGILAKGGSYVGSGAAGRDLSAGLVTACASMAYYVSYAAMLFSGPLAGDARVGIVAALVTGAVLALALAALSAFPFAAGGPEPNTVAVLSVVTAQVASAVPAAAAGHAAVLALVLTAALSGAVLLALGALRLGRLVRYVPYPVVGGFLAATGWFIVVGALDVAAGLNREGAAALAAALDPRLAVGIGFAAAVHAVARRWSSVHAVPAAVAAGTALVHVGLLAAGTDLGAARAQGWLFHGFDVGAPVFAWDALPAAPEQWTALRDALWAASGGIAAAVVVSVLSGLFISSGIEASTGHDADFDRELVALGAGNLASAALGGFNGGLSLSRTTLNRKAGAATRGAAVVAAAVCLAGAVFGGALVGLLPRPVVGGLLLYLGVVILREWLWDGWSRMSRSDYAIMAAILVATATSGFVLAIAAGTAAACVDFALSYGRVGPVRQTLSGAARRSRVERPRADTRLLDAHGDRIRVLRLRGYLFFGSANAAVERARSLMAEPGRPLRFLVIDLARVDGADSSAGYSFARLCRTAAAAGVEVVFSAVPPKVGAALGPHGCLAAARAVEPTLDRALEVCEDALLDGLRPAAAAAPSFLEWLAAEVGSEALARRLLMRLGRADYADGERVFEPGDGPDAIWLLASGAVTDWSDAADGASVRIRTIRGPGMVGEVGFCRGARRSTVLRAEGAVVAWRLTRAALDSLAAGDPEAALALQAMVARTLAERLQHTNAAVAALDS